MRGEVSPHQDRTSNSSGTGVGLLASFFFFSPRESECLLLFMDASNSFNCRAYHKERNRFVHQILRTTRLSRYGNRKLVHDEMAMAREFHKEKISYLQVSAFGHELAWSHAH